ncbi:hypothetical protein [Bacteroides cellulosilyticus]|uniref:hypothetical protein n=1 Tax=Bacteroides cellulosilyticus TaxID=246787 RepID=UPI002F964E95
MIPPTEPLAVNLTIENFAVLRIDVSLCRTVILIVREPADQPMRPPMRAELPLAVVIVTFSALQPLQFNVWH